MTVRSRETMWSLVICSAPNIVSIKKWFYKALWVSVVLRVILRGGQLCNWVLITVQTGKQTNKRLKTRSARSVPGAWPAPCCGGALGGHRGPSPQPAPCSGPRSASKQGLVPTEQCTFSWYFDSTFISSVVAIVSVSFLLLLLVGSVHFCNCLPVLTVFMMVKILAEAYSL